jgi:hypothetical protein
MLYRSRIYDKRSRKINRERSKVKEESCKFFRVLVDSLKFCHKLNGEDDTTRFSRAVVGHFQLINAKTPMDW